MSTYTPPPAGPPSFREVQPAPPSPASSPRATILLSIGALLALLLVTQSVFANIGTLGATKTTTTREFTEQVVALEVSANAEDIDIVASPDDTTRVTSNNITTSWAGRDFATEVNDGVLEVGYQNGFNVWQFSPMIGDFGSSSIRVEVPLSQLQEIKANTSTGSLRLDGTGSASTLPPNISLSTATGAVSVAGTGDEVNLNINTATGSIDATVDGTLQSAVAETSTGAVILNVPTGSYRVQADTAMGAQDINVSTDPTSTRTIRVETSTGNTAIRYAR